MDDVYVHFNESNVNFIDLWQSSHRDARKRSFVALIHNNDTSRVKSDRVLANLSIRVRDYEERKQSSF